MKVWKINEEKGLDFKYFILGTDIIPYDVFHMTSCRRLRVGED